MFLCICLCVFLVCVTSFYLYQGNQTSSTDPCHNLTLILTSHTSLCLLILTMIRFITPSNTRSLHHPQAPMKSAFQTFTQTPLGAFMSPYGHKVEFYFSACPGRSRYISQTRTDQRDCGCIDTLLALYT